MWKELKMTKEIELLKQEIKVLQSKLALLEEIEKHKSQPRMNFLFDGKCEVVSYNKKSYYRFEFPDEVYWYRRTSHETYLDLKLERITDGETHRLLEGVWFNDVKKGVIDEPLEYDEIEWDEKDNPKPMDEVVNKMLKEWEENPPEFLKFELGKTLEALITRWWDDVYDGIHQDWDREVAIDDLVDRIQLWLPREGSSEGSQDHYAIVATDAENALLQKIKSKLRNKK
jgi:hypothetical protein